VYKPPDHIIHFDDVSFSYPGDRILFQNLSLGIRTGVLYHVRGASGVGKSTFLRLIIRLEEPTQGQIFFKGVPLADTNPPHLRRSILYLPQTPVAIDGSVKDNLLLPFTFKANQDLQKPDDIHLTEQLKRFLLDDVRLGDHAQTLSVGQLQRLCFIRGMLLSPSVLLLDEPTSSLDSKSAAIVIDHIETMCKTFGFTILVVSHGDVFSRSLKYHTLMVADGLVRKISRRKELS
jgi:putative ABC transport system ATP-binding protein